MHVAFLSQIKSTRIHFLIQRKKRESSEDESVYDFIDRRLGSEVQCIILPMKQTPAHACFRELARPKSGLLTLATHNSGMFSHHLTRLRTM